VASLEISAGSDEGFYEFDLLQYSSTARPPLSRPRGEGKNVEDERCRSSVEFAGTHHNGAISANWTTICQPWLTRV
jgi:hypothetical protein